MGTTPPRWDLSNVYPGLDSPALTMDIDWVKEATESLKDLYQEELVNIDEASDKKKINQAISTMVDKVNALMEKSRTIRAFLHSFISTDSFNQQASRMSSQFDQVMVEVQKVSVLLEAWLGQFKDVLPEVIALGNSAGEHGFPIKEMAEQLVKDYLNEE